MPRIRYRVAMSLDGYIAGPHGEYDWIVRDPSIDFTALFAQFDTFVMGRRTFELVMRPGNPGLPPGAKIFVFSRTLRPEDHPGVSISAQISSEVVATIRAAAAKDIWLFGGGDMCRSFLNHGFVDTVEVAVMPVILGEGVRLVAHPASQARLTLTNHRIYGSGIALLEYAVGALPA